MSSPISGMSDADAMDWIANAPQDIQNKIDANTNEDGSFNAVLTPAGLDQVSVAIPTGAVSTWNFRERLAMLYRRFFGKATMTSTNLSTYAADGVTVLSQQTLSDNSITQTQGEAS